MNWKPFNDAGAGTKEIRIDEASGIYRVMYVAKFEEPIYMLHCFQKKSQATANTPRSAISRRRNSKINSPKKQHPNPGPLVRPNGGHSRFRTAKPAQILGKADITDSFFLFCRNQKV